MRIAYICYITERDEQGGINKAGDIHSKGLIYGLEKASGHDLDVFTVYPIPMFPGSKRIFSPVKRFKAGEISTARCIPFVNIPIFKQITLFIMSFFLIAGWAWRFRKDRHKVVMMYNLLSVIALPVYAVAKLFSIRFVPHMADPPLSFGEYRGWKTIMSGIESGISRWILGRITYCMYLTRQGAKDFSPQAISHVYKCGVYFNQVNETCPNRPNGKHIVVFSGNLGTIYMVPLILKAFEFLEEDMYEFHVYGRGVYEPQVTEAQSRCSHIKYKGFVGHDKIVDAQKNASLLLSPKNPCDPITPYTFSTKIMEYLASGVPVLLTNNHEAHTLGEAVFIMKELTPQAVAEDIRRVCSLTSEERVSRWKAVSQLLRDEYTWERVGEDIYRFLEKATSRQM